MEKNTNSGYGASVNNGNTLPAWLRHNWEYREVHEARFCFWHVMA